MVGAFVVVCIAVPVGCGGDREKPLPDRSLAIATGSPGGVYADYGAGLAAAVNAHLPRLRASVQQTGGSIANLERLSDGRAQVAFTLADSAAEALRGEGPFSRARVPVRALARLYDNYVQLIVRADSGLSRLDQLAGRRVSIGGPGSGTRLIARRVLALAHLRGPNAPRSSSLDVRDSARALADGRIAAFFWSGGLPTRAVADLRKKVEIRLLDLSSVAARLRDRYEDVYTETVVGRTVYRLREAVTTVSVPNFLVVHRDLDAETAFRLTRLLFEGHPELRKAHPEATRLNPLPAIATFPLTLHPGAERYFRQAGGG